MDTFSKLYDLGQSIWYDNIQRDLLRDGTIKNLINAGIISGITSNPSIFKKAILNSTYYRGDLKTMAWAGVDANAIYETLVIEDIREAADLLHPVYEKTRRKDGYVSLEVSPELAHDTERTVSEALRLWDLVQRSNLMIKIPATKAGIPAIRQAIAAGINVNVTLIFSINRYAEVIDAFLAGLEDRAANDEPLDNIASVASFFVSRFDTNIDKQLDALSTEKSEQLYGKGAIANARMAYRLYQTEFSSERFIALRSKGANIQRPLWASTSTKNPDYSDVLYVEELIGPDTVNTVPPATLDAFKDHGRVADKISLANPGDDQVVESLKDQGIDLEQVAAELEREGVEKFAQAFNELMEALEQQRENAVRELSELAPGVKEKVQQLQKSNFVGAMLEKDARLWTRSPKGQAEIKIRLGWLNAPTLGLSMLSDLQNLKKQVLAEGYKQAILIGMGGSSLAAEVISLIHTDDKDGLALRILDSTSPDQIRSLFNWADLSKTLFIVSSKSGTTAEVMAGFSYAWQSLQNAGVSDPGKHFIAVTDPGTALQDLAVLQGFRAYFNADPNVGGRYSALTAFGLVPAALMGKDVEAFLQRAIKIQKQSLPAITAARNPGLVLGAIMGVGYQQGKTKLTLITDETWQAFGSWAEQLIAESSGKQGKGILPIDKEPYLPVEAYKNDRLFVYLNKDGTGEDFVDALKNAGHPVLTIDVSDDQALSREFYRWEYATAVACAMIGVNAFDQPNVQDAKLRAKQKIKDLQESGKIEMEDALWEDENLRVRLSGISRYEAKDAAGYLDKFLALAEPNDYIAINAFVERDQENEDLLQSFRQQIAEQKGIATTLGFGPRFLHSTGQLHKGGLNNGLFIVLTTETDADIEIPKQGITFQQLLLAQALGDMEALQAEKRRVLHLHAKNSHLQRLIKMLTE